jgi:methionyl-tRNA synthetase
MVGKYFDGKVPAAGPEGPGDRELRDIAAGLPAQIDADLAALAFNRYIQSVWQLVTQANRYVEENAPWSLAKKNDMARLATVLYNLAESLRIIGLSLYPVIPGTCQKIWNSIGVGRDIKACRIQDEQAWGGLKSGTSLQPGEQLFPRIDVKKLTQIKRDKIKTTEKKMEQPAAEQRPAEKPAAAEPELIGIEDFAKVQLRVGKIIAAERVEKSEKLVKLKVDIGTEVRQVVAGIGKSYAPEQLLDKSIVIVANLKPAKLMGVESQGMLLAASAGDLLSVVTPDREIKPGAKVK